MQFRKDLPRRDLLPGNKNRGQQKSDNDSANMQTSENCFNKIGGILKVEKNIEKVAESLHSRPSKSMSFPYRA